jgi:hypothetical protein
VDARSRPASKLFQSWYTLPTSTNAEMRAALVSNSFGKNISTEPTVLTEPPTGRAKPKAFVARGPRVLSTKPRTRPLEVMPPA